MLKRKSKAQKPCQCHDSWFYASYITALSTMSTVQQALYRMEGTYPGWIMDDLNYAINNGIHEVGRYRSYFGADPEVLFRAFNNPTVDAKLKSAEGLKPTV